MADYNMQCPMAAKRLIYSGLPATVEHGKPRPAGASNAAVAVAEVVQHFITAMDSLKLNMVAVDQVYPPLADLLAALNKVPALPADFSGKVKARAWAARVHALPASAELSEGDVRQLLFDLESSYNAFMEIIKRAGSGAE
jgi:ESCRT-I complex subunit VPS28